MKRIIKSSVLSALLSAASLATVQGQQQTVQLVHGFNSSASTWADPFNTEQYLRDSYGVTVVNHSYPWYSGIPLSSALLTVDDPGNTILVGHSEGGIVSRRFAETHAVTGIITLGSPHAGANIATNYRMFLAHLGHALRDMIDVNRYLWVLNGGGLGLSLADYVFSAMDWVWQTLASAIYYLGPVVGYVPTITDLQPNSATLLSMNGDALPAEINNAPHRISLRYEDPMYWSAPAWRLAWGDQTGNDVGVAVTTLQYYAAAVWDEAMSESFREIGNPDGGRYDALQDLMYAASWMVWDLGTIDFEWCADVSMSYEGYWNAPTMTCAGNDLFIRTDAQAAPASASTFAGYARHTAETSRAQDIGAVLEAQFGLRRVH